MLRTLTFTLITDERFGGTLKHLQQLDSDLSTRLNKLSTLIVRSDEIRTLDFADKKRSFRKKYYIQKFGRSITWNDIYCEINKVKGAHYQFIKRNIIDEEIDLKKLESEDINIGVVKSIIRKIKAYGGLILGFSVQHFENRTCMEISFNRKNGKHQFLGIWNDDLNDDRVSKLLLAVFS